MGIFRWIMSLLRRRKIIKHEYTPEKAIALKKSETMHEKNSSLAQQAPCENDKSEMSERACAYPDSQIVLRETQQQKRRRRRQQIQSDTPPVNEQLFAAQNTQDSSDFYPEDEKTTSAANAEAKENQCAAADAEEISEIETGCSIKDMVAIDVCRSEKTEEHEPGQAADKTSAIDESPEADMMLIAQKEDSVSEETENTLAEEAAEAEKNDVQEHQAKIISVETKIDEPQGIEQTEESSADVIDPAEYQLEKEYTGDSENDEKEPVSPESVAEDVYSEVQEGRNFVLDTGGEVRTDYAIQEWKEDKWEMQSENTEESCADTGEYQERTKKEKAERKARNVVRGNLLQEKQNVQRRVISEEEHLRKYILEQFSVQPLLGSIDISKTEFEYLLMPWFKKRAQNILYGDNALNRIDPVFCVCLVQIAIRDSKHGEFWNHVARRLGYSKPTQALMSRFGEIFLHTMKAHQKTVFDSGEKVASILMHCFVCDHHIPKLFDFLYAYYELDLFRQIELSDVRKLRDVMVSGKYYTRKQLILQQTIDVLTYLPELGIERLERYLSWIDHAYFDESYQPEGAGRFVEAFKKWKENHPDFGAKQKERDSVSRKGRRMFSSPELRLNLRNGKFSVIFPRQRIPSDCVEAHWEIVTSVSGKRRVECEMIEAITSNLTGEAEIGFPSADLLGKTQFRLVSGANVLRTFEIEQDCCRAFDGNGSLIRKKHLEAGRVYCFTHREEHLKTEAACTQQQTGDWLMSCYSFEPGMTVEFPDGSIAIIGGEMNEGLCGSTPVQHAWVCDEQKRPLPVYGRLPMLMIKTTPEKYQSGRMSLNSRYYPLGQLPYRRIELGDRSGELGFLIAIPEEQHFIYDIAIDIASEQDVRRYRFAYMDGFDFRFENSAEPLPYLFAPKGSVTIFGNARLRGHDMEKHPNKNEFGFVLDAARQVLEFDVLEQNNTSLALEIPVVAYRFDQQEWRIQQPEEMWHTELPKQIEFRIPGMSLELSVDADADAGRQSVVYSRGQNDATITCDLMPLRSWLGRERFRHDIDLTIDGNRRHFATVYARSAVFSAHLESDYEKGVLHGVFDIVGKSRYVVSLFYGEKPIVEQILVENGEIKVEMPADVGLYKAVIYEVEEDEFGFGEQLYKIGEAECELIDPGNIEGKTFYIKQLLTLKHQEANLPIAHKRYWINVLNRRKNEERKYNGEMRIVDMWGSRPPIPVVITVKKRTMIDHVQITFVNLSGEFPFLYDYLNKTIIQNEDMALHKMEKHRRYERLDYEDLFHVVYLQKEE